MKTLMAVTMKDLRIEARAKDAAVAMALFGLVLVFLFALALPPGAGRPAVPLPQAGSVPAREVASAFLWAAILFASIVGFLRSSAMEKEGGRIEALAMSPADPALVFGGKVLASFIYLSLTELAILPFFLVLIDLDPLLLIPGIIPVAALANLGLSAVGVLFGAASQYTRAREVVLPLLVFPISLPVVLAAMSLTSSLATGRGFSGEARWFILLLAFDIALLAVGATTYEHVINE